MTGNGCQKGLDQDGYSKELPLLVNPPKPAVATRPDDYPIDLAAVARNLN